MNSESKKYIQFFIGKKWLLGLVFLACFSGISTLLVISREYQYWFVVEVGKDTKGSYIESPISLMAKLNDALIPSQILSFASKDNAMSAEIARFTIRARIPKDSGVVVVEASGKRKWAETYKAIMARILEETLKDHASVLESLRSDILLQIKASENELSSAIAKTDALKIEVERVLQSERLAKEQLKVLEKVVHESNNNRVDVLRNGIGDQAKAMTVMLLDRGIEDARERMFVLERRLNIDLPAERQRLLFEIDEQARRKELAVARVEREKLSLNALRNTRAVIAPTQSVVPVGPGNVMRLFAALLLSMVVTGVLGMFIYLKNEYFSES